MADRIAMQMGPMGDDGEVKWGRVSILSEKMVDDLSDVLAGTDRLRAERDEWKRRAERAELIVARVEGLRSAMAWVPWGEWPGDR